MEARELRPVRVILDSDGYLIRVGDPKIKIPVKELRDLTESGCQFLTMDIEQYKANQYTWIWDKPKTTV